MNPENPTNSEASFDAAPGAHGGPKLFISYRRADSASVAGRVYDRLTAYFGREAIFKDVDNIPIGANFEQVIASVIAQCAVTLVLVGPVWATISTERGRRLDDPQDVVRLEIEAALQRGATIIPVMVEGASIPDPTTLPPSLAPLFAHGVMQARNDPWFDGDMSQLATALTRWLPMRAAGVATPLAPGLIGAAPTPNTGASVAAGASTQPGVKQPAPRRHGWLTSPLGLIAVAVLIIAVSLLGLAGAGLVGVGPFGRLGANATPLATAPHLAPTATPVEQVVVNEALTHAQPDWIHSSDCVFQSDGYHVTANSGDITYCQSAASYTNFHLWTQVHLAPGASRADYTLVIRAKESGDLDYVTLSFKLLSSLPPTAEPGASTPTPDYSIEASWRAFSHSNGTGAILGSDLTPAAHVTGDGDNTLEIYADGPTFTFLVNGTPVGSFLDAVNDQAGQIGLGTESGEAIYTNVKIATLAT